MTDCVILAIAPTESNAVKSLHPRVVSQAARPEPYPKKWPAQSYKAKSIEAPESNVVGEALDLTVVASCTIVPFLSDPMSKA
jgi:hypothetical protein